MSGAAHTLSNRRRRGPNRTIRELAIDALSSESSHSGDRIVLMSNHSALGLPLGISRRVSHAAIAILTRRQSRMLGLQGSSTSFNSSCRVDVSVILRGAF